MPSRTPSPAPQTPVAARLAATAAPIATSTTSGAAGVPSATPPTGASPTTAAPAPTASPGTSAAAAAGTPTPAQKARVVLVQTTRRAEGAVEALRLLGVGDVGKRVLLKPNLNSADPAPGSTHPETFQAFTEWLLAHGVSHITIGDRSGMGQTRRVMEETGVTSFAERSKFGLVAFDEMDGNAWDLVKPAASHWADGFAVPRLLKEVDAVVQTCNLKTHRFGGHFTLSLKNAVGLAAKRLPGQAHDYMTELHSSPYQREMIAEINQAYRPALVVIDGVEAFTKGGPDRGTKVASEVVLAGTDRVALDAVGVALLRLWGTTPEVEAGPIFGQAQIARAVALGLGIGGPDQIELVTGDEPSRTYAARVRKMLDA